MNLKMKDLELCFQDAIINDWIYVAVKIQMEGFAEPEIIINSRENFETKLAYYKKAYNDDLTLKSFNGIKIIGFTCADEYEDIESELVWGD